MSLNFGNRFSELAFQLRDDPRFVELRQEMGRHVSRTMARAIDAPVDQRVEQTAYARAVRDLFVIFEASARHIPAVQVQVPETPFIEGLAPQPTHPTPVPEPVETEHPLARGRRPSTPARSALSASRSTADDILA